MYLIAFLEPVSGFGGEPSTLDQFTAIRSGAFNDTNIWSEKIVPYGSCSVNIVASARVTIPRLAFELNVIDYFDYGTLVLGTPNNDSFTFRKTPNIIVYPGGVLQDATGLKQLFSPEGTLFTVYPGGTFDANGSTLTTYTQTRAERIVDTRLTIQTSFRTGYTCGILPGGVIQQFFRVTYMVSGSDDINVGSIFLGRRPPTQSVCAVVGGCGLSVSLNFVLSTVSLGGRINTNFVVIDITVSATMQLGSPELTTDIWFMFPVIINIRGLLEVLTNSASCIYLPFNSVINIFPGGRFRSTAPTSLCVYNSATGLPTGVRLPLTTAVDGPFYVTIIDTGDINTSFIGIEKSQQSRSAYIVCALF